MILSYGRFISAIAALSFLGCSAASACNPGDIHCENGYKFTCKCWTVSGCNYEADGTCYRDDGPSGTAPHVNLSRSKYVREARLMCSSPRATIGLGSCTEH
jgi:hypothetical protein